MQAASKHGFWARTSLHGSGMATTPWQPAPDMVARHVEEEVVRNRAGAVFSQSSGQSWVAAYHPQSLKSCIKSYHLVIRCLTFHPEAGACNLSPPLIAT